MKSDYVLIQSIIKFSFTYFSQISLVVTARRSNKHTLTHLHKYKLSPYHINRIKETSESRNDDDLKYWNSETMTRLFYNSLLSIHSTHYSQRSGIPIKLNRNNTSLFTYTVLWKFWCN